MERPTDYEIELQRIDKDISELEDGAITSPIDIEKATRFVYRRYHRASLTGDLAEFGAVETAINDVIRQYGPWADLCMLKANLDFKFHRLGEVKRDLEMVPGLAGCFQGRALKADLDLQEGRYEDAREGYEGIIRDNRTWDNLVRLAYLEAKMGDIDGAERLYIEAEDEITAKEMRSYAWVELQRGLLDFTRGRYESAWAHYERANEAYSGYWLVDEHIAELLGAQGKSDEAVALYEEVIPNPGDWLRYLVEHRSHRWGEPAYRTRTRAPSLRADRRAKRQPSSGSRIIAHVPRPELQQALGDLYVFIGEPERARPWHEKALAAYLESAQRGDVHYFHHLADFYADVREDGAEAVRWARKDLELRQNSSTQAALAWGLYRDGRFVEALDTMRKALSSGVKDARLLFRAATIYLVAGRTGDGIRFLREAAEINAHYRDFHVHR